VDGQQTHKCPFALLSQVLLHNNIKLEEPSMQLLIANYCDSNGFVNYESFVSDLITELCLDSTASVFAKWHLKKAIPLDKKPYVIELEIPDLSKKSCD